MDAFALRAALIFPVAGPPLRDVCVTIRGERIASIGAPESGVPLHDLGEVALLPGLINAHTHLEFSGLETPLGQPGMSLPEWIRTVIDARALQKSDPAAGITHGIAECIAAGATTVVDIATVEPGEYPASAEIDVALLLEVIAFSTGRADSAVAYLEQKLDAAQRTQWTGVSPHAPYTVGLETVRRVVDVAARRGAIVAMHLAESPEETELLVSGRGPFRDLLAERSMWDEGAVPSGTSYGDYLKVLAKAPRALVIHGNYLSDGDLCFLAERRPTMTLVHCPRTHAYFGHNANPLAAAHHAGVNITLGTDSRASNPDLNILAELRAVARGPAAIAPADILRMATINAAVALGRDSELGTLEPGKLANLTAVQLPATEGDPDECLFASDGPAAASWVRGRPVLSSSR
jgi:cytosine/adenosine deaminase-related metal-dependent hydrolase